MVLTTTKQFHGYTGRVYKLTVGDLNGTVNAYVTRKRFYAIAVLNTKKDDALEEKFLSSFVIPDKPTEQKIAAAEATEPNSVAQSENNEQGRSMRKPRVETEGTTNNNGTTPTANANTTEETVDSNTSQAQPGTPQKKAPISGGVLNSKAIYLPPPEMPPGEKPGVVMVQVLVDEQGTVIEARAVSGPLNLQTSAVIAARLARFLPTVLSGEPVKVSGTLAYNFVHSN
jgi:outer membrane biosynthesis protein TonB